MLFGLYGLVEPFGVAAAQHKTAGKLIHNDDLPVLDYIVSIPLHYTVGLQGLIDMVAQGGVFHIRQVFKIKRLLCLGYSPGGESGGLGLFIHYIVGVQVLVLFFLLVHRSVNLLFQAADEIVCPAIEVGTLVSLAGNNEGGPGLVYEDGVYLVHYGEGVAPLDHVLLVQGHIVPQVVKAHLVIRAVGDVAVIGSAPLLAGKAMDNKADAEAQKAMDFSHPLTITLGQIVVDSDYVYPFPGQGVEVGRQHCNQGLAFAGLHLSYTPLVQYNAAYELHSERLHAQYTPGSLPYRGKSLRKYVVQSLALSQPFLENICLGSELLIAEGGILL